MKFQPELATLPEVGDDFVMSPSVIKILSGALDAIAERGVKRLSMSDIIEASGVSRGTLYRYFSNKDDVLAAVAEFVCVGFETGVREVAEGIENPIERFRRVMQFYARYTNENSPDRVFEVEPRFHLSFFRSRFKRYKLAVHAALEPTFAYIQTKLGKKFDAMAFVEMLVRLQLSTLLVPADENWMMLWNESADSLEKWVLDTAHRIV